MKNSEQKLVVGGSGYGKSWKVGWDIEQALEDGYFIVLLDKKLDHTGLVSQTEGFVDLEEKIDSSMAEDLSIEFFQELFSGLKSQGKRGIRLKFQRIDPDLDLVEIGDKVARSVLPLDFKILAVYEELRNFTPNTLEGGSPKEFKGITTLISEGRSEDKRFEGTCQTFKQIHTEMREVSKFFEVFKIDDKPESYFHVFSKNNPDHKEVVREICSSSQEERKYIHYHDPTNSLEVKTSNGLDRKTDHSG